MSKAEFPPGYVPGSVMAKATPEQRALWEEMKAGIGKSMVDTLNANVLAQDAERQQAEASAALKANSLAIAQEAVRNLNAAVLAEHRPPRGVVGRVADRIKLLFKRS